MQGRCLFLQWHQTLRFAEILKRDDVTEGSGETEKEKSVERGHKKTGTEILLLQFNQ